MSSALRQVIDAMRSGDNPTSHAFSSIALIGHSARGIDLWLRMHPPAE